MHAQGSCLLDVLSFHPAKKGGLGRQWPGVSLEPPSRKRLLLTRLL